LPNSGILRFAAPCAICGIPIENPSMHEVIITRGMVDYAPYEIQIQIYVDWNVVVVHEGACHLYAQHRSDGRDACIYNILAYHTKETICGWLEWLPLTSAKEAWNLLCQ
jgi:hypothetical protein